MFCNNLYISILLETKVGEIFYYQIKKISINVKKLFIRITSNELFIRIYA